MWTWFQTWYVKASLKDIRSGSGLAVTLPEEKAKKTTLIEPGIPVIRCTAG